MPASGVQVSEASCTYCVTGAASGLGAAVTARLVAKGHAVITVDLEDADVLADLSTERGRTSAVHSIARRTDVLQGLVPCAGLGPHVDDLAAIVAVNYFGAVELLEGLRHLLGASGDGAAVAIGSNSATTDPTVDEALVHACLRDDEVVARELASESRGHSVYASSKLALMRHVRRSVTAWGDAGVRLNAIAPGAFHSPLMDAVRADRDLGRFVDAVPVPYAPSFAHVDQIAAPIEFLLSADASWVHGACLFVDGGTDALLNPQVL